MCYCTFILYFAVLSTFCTSSSSEQIEKFIDELNQKEYSEYMRNVMQELLKDKNIQGKIFNQNSTSNKDFMDALDLASSSSRSKLDEIKSREINRLNSLKLQLKRMLKSSTKLSKNERDEMADNLTSYRRTHLHSTEDSKFTKDDMEKLMSQIRHDLRLVDTVREEQYRRYEWQKDWRLRKELEKFKDPVQKSKRLEEIKKSRKSYRKHKRINEPGSEDQFKEIWKSVDNLDISYFNIKTFFNLHDLNQDGNWDINEIEAVVQPDIEKIYEDANGTADPEEKFHEIMKMRQHLMEKVDNDKDDLITLQELIVYTARKDFKSNIEWKTSEESDQSIYSEEEKIKFEKELEEISQSSVVNVDESLN